MYLLKNSLKNLWRNKGRNILFAIIFFAVILICTVGILIKGASGNLISEYQEQFGAKVTLVPDFAKTGMGGQIDSPTTEQLIEFGKSDLLQNTIYTAHISVIPEDLTMIDEIEGMSGNAGITIGGGSGETYRMPKSALIGHSRPEINEDFTSGKREITRGEMYSQANECMISEQLAELNQLSVGDTIQVSSIMGRPITETLTISGIFSDSTMVGQEMMFKEPFLNRNNEILVAHETAINMEMFQTIGYIDAEYYLKTPESLDAFHQELTRKGLPDYFKVSVDEASYRKASAPVESLQQISGIFLVLVVILGGVILFFLSLLATRTRRYEIGVLRAIGMKKGKVGIGLISEIIVITAVCLILGLGIGSTISKPIANTMLQDQIASYNEQQKAEANNALNGMTFSNESETSPSSAEISTNLDAAALIQIVGISLFIILLSGSVSIFYVTRWEPIKILSERN